MRIHILGVPRNASTPEIAMDPYAMVSYYLTTFLHRNKHEVHYYGFKESTVECTKKWVCADINHHNKYNTTDFEKTHWFESHEGNKIMFQKQTDYIVENYKSGDVIISLWSPQIDTLKEGFKGTGINPLIVDGHIGHQHPNKNTAYHVFASHANRHYCYGKHVGGTINEDNYWHDAAIPPIANTVDNFKYTEKKKDYFLFMARLSEGKGLGIFVQLADHFPKKKFIIAGQGHHDYALPSNIEFVGLLNPKERKKYLANAKAVISPSHYPEPFGLTAVEAGLSGTPIISTDHGGYTETVVDGYNGFRCSYFNDFVMAINNIDTIKSKDCRKHAEKFSAESLIKEWEKYLHRINRTGFYTLD